jgi:hypothetical protein
VSANAGAPPGDGNEGSEGRDVPEVPPIACTLDAGSMAERTGEWRAFVSSHVSSLACAGTAVRFVLDDSDAALVAAASLGAREKECCAFFDVSIELEPAHRVLRLAVPEGAEQALATFIGAITQ